MNFDVFTRINALIERDNKSTTYKFALLRGVIDIIQDNSPFVTHQNDRVHIPLGLLVEKWLLYYYPILESTFLIPQINGPGNRLRFQTNFELLIHLYASRGGFSAFYNDLRGKGLPPDVQAIFGKLIHEIRDTIIMMPMKHIGYSLSQQFYSIFTYENGRRRHSGATADREYLINNLGSFSIPADYYQAFKVLGSFINGKDSILVKWAEFSVNASGRQISIHQVMDEVLKSPITQREISASKKLYEAILRSEGAVFCVWSGKKINEFDVDHMIPFSVWKNNDLWNLLPSQRSINSKKKDKIPTPDFLEHCQDRIHHYWNLVYNKESLRFMKEFNVALLGQQASSDDVAVTRADLAEWNIRGIEQLKESCRYLITQRGFEEWKL